MKVVTSKVTRDLQEFVNSNNIPQEDVISIQYVPKDEQWYLFVYINTHQNLVEKKTL